MSSKVNPNRNISSIDQGPVIRWILRVPNFGQALGEYEKLHLPKKKLAKNTLVNVTANIGKYQDMWGHLYCTDITLLMISEYLKQQTDFQAEKHRSQLIDIWKYLVANG